MTIDIVKEVLSNHSDEDIVTYLDSIMTGILQNYKMAAKQNQPELLYGNLGDIALVASVVRAIKKRNDAREAAKRQM